MHLRRGRRVLDQLDQAVAQHHPAGRRRHVAADHEILRARRRRPGERALQVVREDGLAARQVRSRLLDRALERHGIGRQLVARGEQVQPLPRGEADDVLVVPLHSGHVAGGRFPPALVEQERLVPQVERPAAPFQVGETAILRRGLDAAVGLARAFQQAFAQIAGQRRGLLQPQRQQFGLLARRSGQVRGPVRPGEHGRLRRHRGRKPGEGGARLDVQRMGAVRWGGHVRPGMRMDAVVQHDGPGWAAH